VGSTKTVTVDVRVIAATNRSLDEAVRTSTRPCARERSARTSSDGPGRRGRQHPGRTPSRQRARPSPEGPRRGGTRGRQARGGSAEAPPGTETILLVDDLVDDEDDLREPAQQILESEGYVVLTARDGIEALALADGHPGPRL
jgi:hypothetical protein